MTHSSHHLDEIPRAWQPTFLTAPIVWDFHTWLGRLRVSRRQLKVMLAVPPLAVGALYAIGSLSAEFLLGVIAALVAAYWLGAARRGMRWIERWVLDLWRDLLAPSRLPVLPQARLVEHLWPADQEDAPDRPAAAPSLASIWATRMAQAPTPSDAVTADAGAAAASATGHPATASSGRPAAD